MLVWFVGKYLGTQRLPPHYDLRLLVRLFDGTDSKIMDLNPRGTKLKGIKVQWQLKLDLSATELKDDDKLMEKYGSCYFPSVHFCFSFILQICVLVVGMLKPSA